jgi:hypothetical protein
VTLVIKESQDIQVHQDHQVHQDLEVYQVTMELLEFLVKTEIQDQQVHLAHKEKGESEDLLEGLAGTESMAHPEKREIEVG